MTSLLEIVVRQSSIGVYEGARNSQFDDHVLRAARNAANGLPPGGASSKLRSGRVGDHVDRAADGRAGKPWTDIWREAMERPFRARCPTQEMVAALGPADGSLAIDVRRAALIDSAVRARAGS